MVSQLPAHISTSLPSDIRGWIPIDTPAISRALEQQASSLKRITLHHFTLTNEAQSDPDVFPNKFSPMAFYQFTSLEQLEISFLLLFGHQDDISMPCLKAHLFRALPSSIVSFSIVQCVSTEVATAAMDMLEALALQSQQRFKNLRRLMLAVYSEYATKGATSNTQEIFDDRDWPVREELEIELNLCSDCWHEGIAVGSFTQIPCEENEERYKYGYPKFESACCEVHKLGLAPPPADYEYYV